MRAALYTAEGRLIRPRQIFAFSLDEGLFVPAAALDLTVSDLIYEPVTDILIYDGDTLLFDGFADRQQAIENSQGTFTRLRARSRGALLLDNESRPQTYQRTTAEDIFRRHLAPHGFTEIRGHRQALSSFVVGKGMSEWEVLTSFLDKTTGAYPRILPGGIIDIETYLKSQRRVHLSNTRPGAVRYTGYEVRYDRMAPISQVLIADENGLYSTCVRNPVAEKSGISRRRYLTTPKEYADAPVRNAKLRIRSSMEEYFSVLVDAATPSAIGLLDLCIFEPMKDYDGELIATRRTISLTSGGWQTRAVLQDKRHLEMDLTEERKESYVAVTTPSIP